MTPIKQQPRFINLYRVSTKRQDESELGLRAQKSAINSYINSVGGVLINEFKEAESAVNKERLSHGASINLESLLRKRKGLLAAISACLETGSILLVKEITRLTRSPLVYEYLKATGVKFICTDYPTEDSIILGLRVQIGAEHAYQISRKTIEGLAKSTKRIDGRTGKFKKEYLDIMTKNVKKVDHKQRVKQMKEAAVSNENNMKAGNYICTLWGQSVKYSFEEKTDGKTVKIVKVPAPEHLITTKEIAMKLNSEKYLTRNGKQFHTTTVARLYERFC